MSVTLPLALAPDEQSARRRENAPAQLDMREVLSLRPGSRFTRDSFVASGYSSFPENRTSEVAGVAGVDEIAAALTLTLFRVTGTVPDRSDLFGSRATGGVPAGIEFDQQSVTGIDTTVPDLAPLTPGQIVEGGYFGSGDDAQAEAIVGEGYARRKQIALGDKLTIRGTRFTVVGIAKAPLGAYASDIYVRLGVLRTLSGRQGRVNVLRARARSSPSRR
jgi:MacB-like periplasmic core domain